MGFNPFAAGGGAGGDYVHNYTTFDDLGIDTHGKTMEEILKEIADMNLPVNTIITGQLYKEAAPDERIYNCEGEIQITQGKYGQVYWCRATSASISPYSWDSIYNQTTDEDNPIDNILPWTPTYYQSTEINEIKKSQKNSALTGQVDLKEMKMEIFLVNILMIIRIIRLLDYIVIQKEV